MAFMNFILKVAIFSLLPITSAYALFNNDDTPLNKQELLELKQFVNSKNWKSCGMNTPKELYGEGEGDKLGGFAPDHHNIKDAEKEWQKCMKIAEDQKNKH